MMLKLKLLYRVVRRRVERGEDLSEVLKDYPRLTAEQRAEIRADITRVTRRLGDEIGKVYGWDFPKQSLSSVQRDAR